MPCVETEIGLGRRRALVRCHWQLNPPAPAPCPCRTFDIILVPIAIWDLSGELDPLIAADDDLAHFDAGIGRLLLGPALRQSIQHSASAIVAAKLLLPTVTGYPIRNDMVQARLLTCKLAEEVIDNAPLKQCISAFDFDNENNSADLLPRVLQSAVGGILLPSIPGFEVPLAQSYLERLDYDVVSRLSFSWITKVPLPRRRIAMVDGRPDPALASSSRGIFRAAKALGVELVILDKAGHWAEDSSMATMRDQFIPCDLTLDQELPDRIATALAAVREPIDGIVTYTDTHILASALAAKKMGLPAKPAEALECCRDKARTRLIASPEVQVFSASTSAELDARLTSFGTSLRYPLIVKPATGCSSDGVCKVDCEIDLRTAVQRNLDKFPGIAALVEPYVDGPEVDANFVFLDGRLLWSETNDDFPSSAEFPATGHSSGSFVEMSTIMPSVLPASEVKMLESVLSTTLLKMGFRDGVFHLEARVQGSRKKFASIPSGVDLVEETSHCMQSPSTFLIEINPRLPGHQESFAVEYTYGIDYFALHLLLSAPPRGPRDNEAAFRDVIHALSQPLPAALQYPSHIVFIPAERGGVFRGVTLPPQHLMDHVSQHFIFMSEGELIPEPKTEGKWPFVAFFLLVARMTGKEGRDEVRTIGELVRQTLVIRME